MSKASKYILISFITQLIAALILFILIRFDRSENSFYASTGIVYFTQYFILSAGIVSLFFASLGMWQSWLNPSRKTIVATLIVHFPVMLIDALFTYAGLLFFTVV